MANVKDEWKPVKNGRMEDISQKEKENDLIAYIYSPQYVEIADGLKKVPERASMTHELIAAYEIFSNSSKIRIISPKSAKFEDISKFHSEDYIKMLQTLSEHDDIEKYDEEADQYGLCYDCPGFEGVYEYAAFVSGASITAAKALVSGDYRVAINWPGGWHHAKKDEASGFCYFNDIVLAILKLREKYDKVMYVDIDLHHGDGVEDAFCGSPKVLTVSFHKYSPGFFPGSGSISDVGYGKGKFYSINVPFEDGIDDDQFFMAFERVMRKLREQYCPDAIVCQCGADGVTGDPMKSFNLTPKGLGKCVECLLNWKLPILLLGGGGYHVANTARCWTYLTSLVTKQELPDEIPEHKYFLRYGPDYSLDIPAGNRTNKNTTQYIDDILNEVLDNLDEIV